MDRKIVRRQCELMPRSVSAAQYQAAQQQYEAQYAQQQQQQQQYAQYQQAGAGPQ
jgi:hypothetical protein